MSKTRPLTFDDIDKVITATESNSVSAFKIPYKKVSSFFEKTVTPKEFQDTLQKALQFYFENVNETETDLDTDLAIER